MKSIIQLDKAVFHFINTSLSNSFFDWLMPLLRISHFWLPFYIFLLSFALLNFKKNVWIWILLAIVCVSATDYFSSSVVKPFFHRQRPFLNADVMDTVRVLVPGRPGNASFTSSHAANHFGLAAYIFFSLKKYYGNSMFLFFVWAALICFAQVYVGVHFPLDIAGGGLIGIVFGYLCAETFNRKFSLI